MKSRLKSQFKSEQTAKLKFNKKGNLNSNTRPLQKLRMPAKLRSKIIDRLDKNKKKSNFLEKFKNSPQKILIGLDNRKIQSKKSKLKSKTHLVKKMTKFENEAHQNYYTLKKYIRETSKKPKLTFKQLHSQKSKISFLQKTQKTKNNFNIFKRKNKNDDSENFKSTMRNSFTSEISKREKNYLRTSQNSLYSATQSNNRRNRLDKIVNWTDEKVKIKKTNFLFEVPKMNLRINLGSSIGHGTLKKNFFRRNVEI